MPSTISPLSRLRIRRIGERDQLFRRRRAQQVACRRTECCVGKAAQRPRLLFERPGAGQLGDGGEQRRAALGDPQPSHQRRRVFAAIGMVLDRGGEFGEQRLRARRDQPGQKSPFLDREPTQKRAVAKDRSEQPLAGRRPAPIARRAGVGIVAGRGERLAPILEAERQPAPIGRLRQSVAVRCVVCKEVHLLELSSRRRVPW